MDFKMQSTLSLSTIGVYKSNSDEMSVANLDVV